QATCKLKPRFPEMRNVTEVSISSLGARRIAGECIREKRSTTLSQCGTARLIYSQTAKNRSTGFDRMIWRQNGRNWSSKYDERIFYLCQSRGKFGSKRYALR